MSQASNRKGLRGVAGLSIAAALILTACSGGETSSPGGTTARTAKPKPGTPSQPGDPVGEDPTDPTTPSTPGTNPTGPTGPVVMTTGDESWADGKKLEASVTIAAGAKVEIAPGAQITALPGVVITVLGTLKASSASKHAKISGAGWAGIVVGSGGTMALDGVDMEGAGAGITTKGGNAEAKYDNGTLKATIPFSLEAGSKLSTTHAFASGGSSAVNGALTASYLDYDKGSGAGLTMSDANASMSIEDSTLHGMGGGDYIISSQAKLLHLAYTVVSDSHCPFHFSGLTKFEMDHVTAKTSGYGSMLYLPDPGPHSITNSNFQTSASHDLELTETGVQLTLDNVYLGGSNGTQNSVFKSAPTIKNKPTAAIANASPR